MQRLFMFFCLQIMGATFSMEKDLEKYFAERRARFLVYTKKSTIQEIKKSMLAGGIKIFTATLCNPSATIVAIDSKCGSLQERIQVTGTWRSPVVDANGKVEMRESIAWLPEGEYYRLEDEYAKMYPEGEEKS